MTQTFWGNCPSFLPYLTLFAHFHVERGENGSGYRPIRLVVPATIVRQWAEEITMDWKAFELVMSFGEDDLGTKCLSRTVRSTPVNELPKMTHWPQDLKYIFDTSNPRAAKTIFLTSYETHAVRSTGYQVTPL